MKVLRNLRRVAASKMSRKLYDVFIRNFLSCLHDCSGFYFQYASVDYAITGLVLLSPPDTRIS